jgi:type I restriction enzyme S subunit
MAAEWPTLTLRDAGVSLIDCDHRTPPSAGVGYPYIAIPQLKSGHIDIREARRITREHFVEWTRRAKPRADDIILSRRCNPGETAWVPPGLDCALGQNLVLLRADGTRIDPPFLRWLVRSPIWWEQIGKFLNVGAVFDSLRCADIPNFELPIPSISEQRRIVGVLRTMDDQIEVLRKNNAALESMAHALFKSWFVDFDPVRAKTDGRMPTGMDAATAALFPNRFEDSALGQIPSGWQVRPIRDVVHGVFDGPHATPPDVPIGPVFLGIGNFTGTSLDLTRINHISEADWPRWTKRVTPQGGDIVFTYEATLGRFAIIPPWLRCCLGRRTALIRPHAGRDDGHFLFHWFTSRTFQEFLTSRVHPGATVDRILLSDFPDYPILCPPTELVARFDSVASMHWRAIHAGMREALDLTSIRDALLPRLLSGELTPPAIVGAAS